MSLNLKTPVLKLRQFNTVGPRDKPRMTATELLSLAAKLNYSLLQGTTQYMFQRPIIIIIIYVCTRPSEPRPFWAETDQRWCPEIGNEAETSESLAEARPRWGVSMPRELRRFNPSAEYFSRLQRFIFTADIGLAVYF